MAFAKLCRLAVLLFLPGVQAQEGGEDDLPQDFDPSQEGGFWGGSPLHEAARQNEVHLVLHSSAYNPPWGDLNLTEHGTGQTPLMAAVMAGAAKSVKFLLENGADPDIPEKEGFFPFHAAAFMGHVAVGQSLLEHRLHPSDPLARHKDGFTPLHRACWGANQTHTDMVKFLVKEAKIDPGEKSAHGKTCMSMSTNKATLKFIEFRIKKNKEAAPSSKDEI